MFYSVLKKIIFNRLRICNHWVRDAWFVMFLVPILFINLGINPVVAKTEISDCVIRNYSDNAAVLNVNRLETRVLTGIKIKRVSLSSVKLIYVLKNEFRLKLYNEVNYFLFLNNIPLENYELKYLHLDLPPPFSIV